MGRGREEDISDGRAEGQGAKRKVFRAQEAQHQQRHGVECGHAGETLSNSLSLEHEVVEERTEKVDGSRITTEALKFRAKEFALHLGGRREPPQ